MAAAVMTFTAVPVSYTHLDVYKRQVYDAGDLAPMQDRLAMNFLMDRSTCLLYTSRCV